MYVRRYCHHQHRHHHQLAWCFITHIRKPNCAFVRVCDAASVFVLFRLINYDFFLIFFIRIICVDLRKEYSKPVLVSDYELLNCGLPLKAGSSMVR